MSEKNSRDECLRVRIFEKASGKEALVRFEWITSIMITVKNLEELIEAGRGRGKIENEGFNNQKTGLYRIEHLNSRNINAMKNHYLLTQLSDIIMQLYLLWELLRKEAG